MWVCSCIVCDAIRSQNGHVVVHNTQNTQFECTYTDIDGGMVWNESVMRACVCAHWQRDRASTEEKWNALLWIEWRACVRLHHTNTRRDYVINKQKRRCGSGITHQHHQHHDCIESIQSWHRMCRSLSVRHQTECARIGRLPPHTCHRFQSNAK